jgi:hypothetical protein
MFGAMLVNDIQVGAMIHAISTSAVFGVTGACNYGGIVADIRHLAMSAIHDDPEISSELWNLLGYESSYWEHQIFLDANADSAISAVRGLQLAAAAGIEVYVVDKDNADEILPLLPYNTDKFRALAKEQEHILTLPAESVDLGWWKGLPYIDYDPIKRAMAFKLDAYNGGFTTCDKLILVEGKNTKKQKRSVDYADLVYVKDTESVALYSAKVLWVDKRGGNPKWDSPILWTVSPLDSDQVWEFEGEEVALPFELPEEVYSIVYKVQIVSKSKDGKEEMRLNPYLQAALMLEVEYTGEDYIHMEIDLWDYYYNDPPPANERYFHIDPLKLPFLANRPCEKMIVTIGSEQIVCTEENGRLKPGLVSINLDKRDPFYKRSQDQYEEEITIIAKTDDGQEIKLGEKRILFCFSRPICYWAQFVDPITDPDEKYYLYPEKSLWGFLVGQIPGYVAGALVKHPIGGKLAGLAISFVTYFYEWPQDGESFAKYEMTIDAYEWKEGLGYEKTSFPRRGVKGEETDRVEAMVNYTRTGERKAVSIISPCGRFIVTDMTKQRDYPNLLLIGSTIPGKPYREPVAPYVPYKKGGGDRIMEARNETAIILGVRDIYGNDQTSLIVEVGKIKVYYDDGKSRDLTVDEPEFLEWIDFKGKTQIAMPEGSYQVTFNFEWGPLKWNAFDVYFTTNLDPETKRKIEFVPAKP